MSRSRRRRRCSTRVAVAAVATALSLVGAVDPLPRSGREELVVVASRRVAVASRFDRLRRGGGARPLSSSSLDVVRRGSVATTLDLRGGDGRGLDPTVAATSAKATAQLLSAVGLGALAASHGDALDVDAVRALSRLAYRVFQPPFLLCTVATTLAASRDRASSSSVGGVPTKALLLLPVACLAQIAVGALCAAPVLRLFGRDLDEDERRDARCCMSFGNAGTLPFLLTAAVCRDDPVLSSDASAALSFYMLSWSPAFWTYGRRVLTGPDDDDPNERTFATTMRTCLPPPVAGALAGVVVGLVPPLRTSLVSPDGLLHPLFAAMRLLGTAYLPAAVLVLAGSLVGSGGDGDGDGETRREPSSDTAVRLPVLLSVLATRFLLVPGVVFAGLRRLREIAPDLTPPVVFFVVLMEACMPPAQNSVIILQLAGARKRAERMARTLTLLYGVSVVPVTILISAALQSSGMLSSS